MNTMPHKGMHNLTNIYTGRCSWNTLRNIFFSNEIQALPPPAVTQVDRTACCEVFFFNQGEAIPI